MAWTEADIPDQTGHIAVVTGANGGLGYETTRALAAKGATVVMASRNQEKAKGAEKTILEHSPQADLDLRALDLASLASVQAFSQGVLSDYDSIDLLINNAGVMATAQMETADGFELQFGTNHLGHFALTAHLMPALLRTGMGRVVTVTSTARYFRKPLDPADPHLRNSYDPWRAYGQAKTANIQFAVELNRRLDSSEAAVVSLAADPGFTDTNLQKESVRLSGGSGASRFFATITPVIGMSPARGALSQLRAATDPQAGGGELYAPRWIANGSPIRRSIGSGLLDPDELEQLWELSESETGIEFDVAGMVGER
ncbi:MAG: oxidoreductase [Acidimicrobiia bacterium]|nr:MAG: oxidoreductase [Acidimicrobiia bacterium]